MMNVYASPALLVWLERGWAQRELLAGFEYFSSPYGWRGAGPKESSSQGASDYGVWIIWSSCRAEANRSEELRLQLSSGP